MSLLKSGTKAATGTIATAGVKTGSNVVGTAAKQLDQLNALKIANSGFNAGVNPTQQINKFVDTSKIVDAISNSKRGTLKLTDQKAVKEIEGMIESVFTKIYKGNYANFINDLSKPAEMTRRLGSTPDALNIAIKLAREGDAITEAWLKKSFKSVKKGKKAGALIDFYEKLGVRAQKVDWATGNKWRKPAADKLTDLSGKIDNAGTKLKGDDVLKASKDEQNALLKTVATDAQDLAIQSNQYAKNGLETVGAVLSRDMGNPHLNEALINAAKTVSDSINDLVKAAKGASKLGDEVAAAIPDNKIAKEVSAIGNEMAAQADVVTTPGNVAKKIEKAEELAKRSDEAVNGVVDGFNPQSVNTGRVMSLVMGFDAMAKRNARQARKAGKTLGGQAGDSADKVAQQIGQETIASAKKITKAVENVGGDPKKTKNISDGLDEYDGLSKLFADTGDQKYLKQAQAVLAKLEMATAELATSGSKELIDQARRVSDKIRLLVAITEGGAEEAMTHTDNKLAANAESLTKAVETSTDPVTKEAAKQAANVIGQTRPKLSVKAADPKQAGKAQKAAQQATQNKIDALDLLAAKADDAVKKNGIDPRVSDEIANAQDTLKVQDELLDTTDSLSNSIEEAAETAAKRELSKAAASVGDEIAAAAPNIGPEELTKLKRFRLTITRFSTETLARTKRILVNINLKHLGIALLGLSALGVTAAFGYLIFWLATGRDDNGEIVDKSITMSDQDKIAEFLRQVFSAAIQGKIELEDAIGIMEDLIAEAKGAKIKLDPIWEDRVQYLRDLLKKFDDNYQAIATGKMDINDLLNQGGVPNWWKDNWWWVAMISIIGFMLLGILVYFVAQPAAPAIAPTVAAPAGNNYGFAFL